MTTFGLTNIYMRLPRYRENIWDHAAGALVVEEAGGRVSDIAGRPLDFALGSQLCKSVTGIVATNGAAHEALLEALCSTTK